MAGKKLNVIIVCIITTKPNHIGLTGKNSFCHLGRRALAAVNVLLSNYFKLSKISANVASAQMVVTPFVVYLLQHAREHESNHRHISALQTKLTCQAARATFYILASYLWAARAKDMPLSGVSSERVLQSTLRALVVRGTTRQS
jgi:hypothetical protein